jgi:hypothetical protein
MTDEIDPTARERLARDLETRKRLQEIGQKLAEEARYQGPSLEERFAALEARVTALENIKSAAAQPAETESPDLS